MSKMDHAKAVDKIKKLLRLATSDNPHEAAAAMRQARALMNKFRLDDGDIQLSEVFESSTRSGARKAPPQWEAIMVAAVAQAYSCRILFMTGAAEWRFIGEMAELASYTLSLLLRQVRQARKGFIFSQLKRCKSATKIRRADVFCGAWVSAVRSQVMDFAGVDEPSAAADAYMLKHYPETTQLAPRDRNAGKSHTSSSAADAIRGALAARDVRLNHGVKGQSQLALG